MLVQAPGRIRIHAYSMLMERLGDVSSGGMFNGLPKGPGVEGIGVAVPAPAGATVAARSAVPAAQTHSAAATATAAASGSTASRRRASTLTTGAPVR